MTSGFLHFGIIHLAFNMYLLYMLGQMLEPAIGRIRFALVYIASLLGGSAGAMLIQPNGFHGGASGAVFGLMAAGFVGYMLRGVNPLTTGIGTTLLLNVVITFSIPGISRGGHIGGAVAGALCGLVVLAPGYKRYPEWMSYAVPVAVSVDQRGHHRLRHPELTDFGRAGRASAQLRGCVTPPEQDGGMTENETPQQLTLLPSTKPSNKPSPNVPLQFRLDEATRRRGLQHVAELRRLLASRQAAKASTPPSGRSDRTASQCDSSGSSGMMASELVVTPLSKYCWM